MGSQCFGITEARVMVGRGGDISANNRWISTEPIAAHILVWGARVSFDGCMMWGVVSLCIGDAALQGKYCCHGRDRWPRKGIRP